MKRDIEQPLDLRMFESIDINDDISKISCVYFLLYDNELVYVGQTINLRKRIQTHNRYFNSNLFLGDKKLGEDSFNKILYYLEVDKTRKKTLEKMYYEMFEPKLNFSGLITEFTKHGSRADYTKFQLKFGLEKRYEL